MSAKVVIVSQHYPPDPSTTAAIMSEIARHLAAKYQVLVCSGTAGSATSGAAASDQLAVVEIRSHMATKTALVRRAASELLYAVRAFTSLLRCLRRADVVITVTAPFVLPYAVAAAARLRGARAVLIMHDLFPEVLVTAGLLAPASLPTRLLRSANALMFQAFAVVVTIGRDTERLLLRYRGLTQEKIRFIPNWATLTPAVRPIEPTNRYRRQLSARFVVGLSGNLGFTHDPMIVFEAARLLLGEADIHFLLSGWGVGFERLKQLQSEVNLANVSLVDRVDDGNLEQLLSAANIWLIPYLRNVAGVSVPSRFYNLLAVGRPVILVSEPEAEAAMTVREKGLGWVVMPGMPEQLADTIKVASNAVDVSMAQRAVAAAMDFSLARAMMSYSGLVDELMQNRDAINPRQAAGRVHEG